jgi:hypothetical protein
MDMKCYSFRQKKAGEFGMSLSNPILQKLSMKLILRRLFLIVLGSTLCFIPACINKTKLPLIDFAKAEMYQLPQRVIDFYYNAEEDPKQLFFVMDSTFTVAQKFSKTSSLTETHYTIQINHQDLHLRERDFRAPFLIYDGKMYFSKSRILKGKLMTPQDLFIYFVDLKTVLQ